MALSILSLNVWGGHLHAPLLDFLPDVDADILCLQEVVRTENCSSEWLFYRDGSTDLPQRANLFGEICRLLPDHQPFFAPVARGDLFDGDKAVPSEFGLATFIRSSLPVIGQHLAFVHGQFEQGGWGAHPRSRNAHAFRIFDYGSGRPLTVVQMHGLRDPAGKGDTPARAAQADALVRMIRTIWPGDEALVVAGDLNILPDSSTFAALGGLGLADLVTGRGFDDTRTSYYPKPQRYADYMLVTPDAGVLEFEVLAGPEVSDHRALRLVLR